MRCRNDPWFGAPWSGALHFGLLDQPSSTAGRGIPFVFEEYTQTGTIDMTAVSGDTLQITPQDQQIESEYPLYGTIATYP